MQLSPDEAAAIKAIAQAMEPLADQLFSDERVEAMLLPPVDIDAEAELNAEVVGLRPGAVPKLVKAYIGKKFEGSTKRIRQRLRRNFQDAVRRRP